MIIKLIFARKDSGKFTLVHWLKNMRAKLEWTAARPSSLLVADHWVLHSIPFCILVTAHSDSDEAVFNA